MSKKARDPLPLAQRRRLLALACALFGLFALLLLQFYSLQVVQGERWQQAAQRQHTFLVQEPFHRGTFYVSAPSSSASRQEPIPLTVDVQHFHLFVDPLAISVEAREELISRLSVTEALDPDWLRRELSRKSRSRRLKAGLDHNARDAVLAWWRPFARAQRIPRNALYFVKDYQRSYPHGALLGQVLHTIRERKDEDTKQAQPTGGLELYFNERLKGKLGQRRLLRSPRHAIELGELVEAPVDGEDIYLSFDLVLQQICEEEMQRAVEAAQAKAGWAVMMDPFSGELLALAQYPSFDPSSYRDYFNDPSLTEHSKVKAISDAFEPGSTMKPLTAALALEANQVRREAGEALLFSVDEKVPCHPRRFPGRSKPIKDVRDHAFLNLAMALQKSSNVYVVTLAQRIVQALGEEWYADKLRRTFGFGSATGLELPAESAGIVPRPGQRSSAWSADTPYSLAFGYNLQVTSVQMVQAWATLANGGFLVQPTLVRKHPTSDDDGARAPGASALVQGQRVLTEETVSDVRRALRFSTLEGGAARRANIPGYSQAGKTGTSRKLVGGEYSTEKYFATFVGFAPLSDPRFVLLIAIDEPKKEYRPGQGMGYYGSVCAAPTFRRIALRSLEYLGVPPDDPSGYPWGDPRRDEQEALWREEAKALKALYEEWNSR